MAKPTVAELQLKLSVHGLQYATSLREALKRVGGAEIRRNLDAQAKALLGIDSAMKKAGKSGSAFGSFLKIASRGTIVAQGLYRGFKMVGGAIAASLEPLMEFEHNMTRVRAKGQLSAADTKAASAAVKALTGQTQYGPVAASEAAVGLAAAGRGKTLATDLPTMLRFAQANDIAPEKSTEILLGMSGQMGMKGPGDLERIGDMVTKADQLSVLNVGEIYDTMKYVGPLARDAGVSLQSVLSMVVSLGDAGIKGSKAGTGLRNLLSAIAAPPRRAKQAQKQLDKIHLTQEDLRAGFEDIPKFLRDLEQRFEKYGIQGSERIAINKIMFGQYGMTATSALLGDSGIGESGVSNITKNRNDIAASNRLMREQAELMGGTLKNKIQQVNAEWELMQLNMNELNLPKLNSAIDKMLQFMRGTGGQDAAKSAGELTAALAEALPPAIQVATASINLMVQYFKDVDRTLGLGIFKKDVQEREVSPEDEAFVTDQVGKAARQKAHEANLKSNALPWEDAWIDPYEAEAKARAAHILAEAKRKKAEIKADVLASMTPDERRKYEDRQEAKRTGGGKLLREPDAPTAAAEPVKPHVPGEVFLVIEASDEFKAKIKKVIPGTGPLMNVGLTSQ